MRIEVLNCQFVTFLLQKVKFRNFQFRNYFTMINVKLNYNHIEICLTNIKNFFISILERILLILDATIFFYLPNYEFIFTIINHAFSKKLK